MPKTDTTAIPTIWSDRMATGADSGPVHPHPTRRSGYRYLFYNKHHGLDPDAAQWDPSLSRDEEFAIFDMADDLDLADDRGWLYGIARSADGEVRQLGTWQQQVAEYPRARPNEAWHGYPLWPLAQAGPENRRGEECRPAKAVFSKMEAAGLLTAQERKRLYKGKHL